MKEFCDLEDGSDTKPFRPRVDAERHVPRERVYLCDTRCKRWTWGIVIFCVLLSVAVILGVSIKQVESTEYGVEYDVHTKQLNDAIQSGVLHVGPPGFEFIKFPSTYITQDVADTCLSRDGLAVAFVATYQFQMPEQWLLAAVLKYRNFERWAALVESAAMSAIFHACSDYNITDYQNERGMIQQTMEDNMRIKLEGEDGSGASGMYAKAISLQLKNVGLPERYSTAVAEKQAANEDIALAINQRSQEVTKAQTALLTSKEEARKIMNTAMNDANVTLTQAKLKVEETIFAFETEAATLVSMKDMLNLTVDGVLGLLANDMLATVPTLKVKASEPARFSQKYQE